MVFFPAMGKGNRLLKIYFIVAILYGVLGLADNLFLLTNNASQGWADFAFYASVMFIAFSLMVLAKFWKTKEKILLVLPAYHIILFAILLTINFAQGQKLIVITSSFYWSVVCYSLASSAAEIAWAGYILKKFKLISRKR